VHGGGHFVVQDTGTQRRAMQPNTKSSKSNEALSLTVMMIILIVTQIVIYAVTAPYA
jgi:hypothetical protein